MAVVIDAVPAATVIWASASADLGRVGGDGFDDTAVPVSGSSTVSSFLVPPAAVAS